MKFILLTILLPCVFGQQGNCPPLPEDFECNPPNLPCHFPPGPDGCPVPPTCEWVQPYDHCSAMKSCPTVCAEGEIMCPGPIDMYGCQAADVCHLPTQDNCPSPCPALCGHNQMHCPGAWDPVSECSMPDTCLDFDPSAICQPFCPPPPCQEPEVPCPIQQDYNGCDMPPTCSLPTGVCPQ